jgi:hypothetical protein
MPSGEVPVAERMDAVTRSPVSATPAPWCAGPVLTVSMGVTLPWASIVSSQNFTLPLPSKWALSSVPFVLPWMGV